MGGHVLESWKEEMIRIGRTEGHAEGQKNLLSQQIAKKLQKENLLSRLQRNWRKTWRLFAQYTRNLSSQKSNHSAMFKHVGNIHVSPINHRGHFYR